MLCSKTGGVFRDCVWFDPEMAVFCAMCCYEYLIPLTRPYSPTGFRPSRVRLPQSMHCQRCRCSLSRFMRICSRLCLAAHLAEQNRSRCGGMGRQSRGHNDAEALLSVMSNNPSDSARSKHLMRKFRARTYTVAMDAWLKSVPSIEQWISSGQKCRLSGLDRGAQKPPF